ncbi:TetR/AcrR family transcriptional regulator [Actinospica durhamensis]|uniref:TetR/AcrR family transcriptional regulator n=1 Tax=Actinospica durhamensis TaxID=1508375 RepID=A0A941EJW7_9ACTN|nr:TetR/AcrR family transcriptional regulator [Actinospica durhamensis]MBR7832922.1 TetR/AcrR family transcriptional regulator [Actinospica durhamensis]
MTEERRRGRPRTRETDLAILTAAREVLLEDGYGRLTMEHVAARAGVGKPTVYRRWPSKAQLVGETMLHAYTQAVAGAPDGPVDSGDIGRDLAAWLHTCAQVAADPRTGPLVLALAAASAASPEDADTLQEAFTRTQHLAVVHRLEVAVKSGQLREDVALDAIADALIGTVLYRLLTGRSGDPGQWVEPTVELVLRGSAPPGR